MLLLSWFSANLVPFFGAAVDFLGASVTPISCWLIPLLLYMRMCWDFPEEAEKSWTLEWILIALECLLALILVVFGVRSSLLKIIETWSTYGAPFDCHCEGLWETCGCSDLKLENICFCEQSPTSTHIKVIDWGLAGSFEQGRMKSSVGTSTYSAPEVLDPEDDDDGYTCACDLWSLGVVAYVALSGKPPFWGSPKQQVARMRAEKYPLSGEFWDTISEDAKDLIQQLLKTDVQVRLTADQVIRHPWLKMGQLEPDKRVLAQVLTNLEQFSRAPDFFTFCVAS
ncbi:unnamed protein product, partial [Durusdinium trenchii]